MMGLYQCMVYDAAGFRLVIGPNTKLAVEIYPAPGHEKARYISGKTGLELRRLYTATLRFDGKFAYLYLDGKLNGSVETVPPAPWREPITVGDAVGKDYFLTGVICGVKVWGRSAPSHGDGRAVTIPQARRVGGCCHAPHRRLRPVWPHAARPGVCGPQGR